MRVDLAASRADVVVAREDAGEDDRRVRRLAAAQVDERAQAARDVGDLRVAARLACRRCSCPRESTITFGFTPSSSPFSSRHRMCSMRSAPQPKSAAFQPKKFAFQFARNSG